MSEKINCKAYANYLEENARNYASRHHTKLVIITTTEANAASKLYMRNKIRAGERTNVFVDIVTCSSFNEIIETIKYHNVAPDTNGIIVQLPLPSGYDVAAIQRLISPLKDVDGFNPLSSFDPCTPTGILGLLHYYNYPLSGKHCVIIGRSDIVGKPLSRLLLTNDATVTTCHSRTPAPLLKTLCSCADYVFCAAATPNLITLDNVNPNAIYIDISINCGGTCGDLSPEAQKACRAYTPVPRGIGPVTVAQLITNTCKATKENF